jgi:magnesium transporter
MPFVEPPAASGDTLPGDARTLGYARAVEARSVRAGVVDADPVAVDDLRRVISKLDEGVWIWVDAIDPTADELVVLQRELGLHDLAIEDVQHRNQRPKLEPYPGHAFAVLRPVAPGPNGMVESEIFLFASDAFLVTLRFEPYCDLTAAVKRWPVLSELAPGTGSALYAIADEIVDDYLAVVEQLEERADELESKVFGGAPTTVEEGPPIQRAILRLRRDAVRLRRHAVPMRQALDRLADDSPLMTERLVPYVRDLIDHLLRTVELTDGIREILTTIVDIRMAQSSNQLNEVMKKLTAWAGIILVPTLIAGVYGMNFDQMPELHWTLGYPMALGLMALSALALYVGFRRRGWL